MPMPNALYQSAAAAIQNRQIGRTTMIRIFKSVRTEPEEPGKDFRERFTAYLYEDVQFLLGQLGGIKEVSAKKNGDNCIVIMQHESKALSHLYACLSPCARNVFRLEAAGDSGLIDYDGDKNIPVLIHTECGCPCREPYEKHHADEMDISPGERDPKVLEAFEMIFQAFQDERMESKESRNSLSQTADGFSSEPAGNRYSGEASLVCSGQHTTSGGFRCAILGVLHMHVYSYMDALQKLGVEIAGFYERNTEEAHRFKEQTGLPLAETIDTLLAQPLDFVLICSENSLHKEYTLAAAPKGLHVIVEKPIATTAADAEEMIACCRANHAELFICFPVRYAAPVKEALEFIQNGGIGKIQAIVGTNHGSMPGGWFVDPSRSGGGCVIDHTVHVADIINVVMRQEVSEVQATMDRLIHDIPAEDNGLLLLEFADRTVASIDTSWNRPKASPSWGDLVIDFIGDKGSLRVDAFLEHATLYADSNPKSVFLPFGNDMDFAMIQDFVRCIEAGEKSPVPGEDGLFALDIALRAYAFCRKE